MKAFDIPLSWPDLFKRTAKEFNGDNCLGLSAQLAYYLLLGMVPALVFLVALTSFFPPQLIQQMMASLSSLAPPEMTDIVRSQIESIASGEHGGLLTLSFGMALWSSSAALVSMMDALNHAYDGNGRRL